MPDMDETDGSQLRVRRRRKVSRTKMGQSEVPALLILAALVAGLLAGFLVGLLPPRLAEFATGIAAPVGTLWLNALQMTILPLVMGLLITGVFRTSEAAQAGTIARNTFILFGAIVLTSALIGALFTPLLLNLFPLSPSAAEAFGETGPDVALGTIPVARDFALSIIPPNIFAALMNGSILPVMIFTLLFALAALRLPRAQRDLVAQFANALSSAMMTVVHWVFRLAPIGVFAIGMTLSASQGIGLVGVLLHYVMIVTIVGGIVLAGAYLLPVVAIGRKAATFAKAVAPVQALALSTQSSVACLPAMLDAARRLKLRESTSDFVLPMAVAVFKATSPAMNLAVAMYIARWSGVHVPSTDVAAGIAVAVLISAASPGLPGSISFIASIAPICQAMGLPLAPLVVLLAVEVVPDLMRTVGNVTCNVAVAEVVDGIRDNAKEPLPDEA